jgi:hypothetical protein
LLGFERNKRIGYESVRQKRFGGIVKGSRRNRDREHTLYFSFPSIIIVDHFAS